MGQEDPLEKRMLPTPVFLPGEFHGQRNLVGYRPWGHKEATTYEELITHTHTRAHTHTHTFSGPTNWRYTQISMWNAFSKSRHLLLQISVMISSKAQVNICCSPEVCGFAAE